MPAAHAVYSHTSETDIRISRPAPIRFGLVQCADFVQQHDLTFCNAVIETWDSHETIPAHESTHWQRRRSEEPLRPLGSVAARTQ
jgi:hypothetical protein